MRTTLQKQRCRLPLWLLACLMTFCSIQARADNDTWTYNTTAHTLTKGNVTISNVTAADNKALTIGNNKTFSGALDLTGTINDSYTITKIGEQAFSQSTSLTSITIPTSVTEIGKYAFNSAQVTTVSFEESSNLKTIGESAFSNTPLKSIQIPSSVTTIMNSAFLATSLTSVTFGDNSKLDTIKSRAFGMCDFTTITIPSEVKAIEENAFINCSALAEITIPASVTTIEKKAFYNCSKLAKVTYLGKTEPTMGIDIFTGTASGHTINIPNGDEDDTWTPASWGVASKDDMSFGEWKYNATNNKLVKGKKELTVTLANTTELTIGQNTSFEGNLDLPESIASTDEKSQTKYTINAIGDNAFYTSNNITNLTSIKLPSTVTKIGDNAFQRTPLKSINIPAAVTTIGEYAFYWCKSLKTVTFADKATLETIGKYAFASCTGLTTLVIPASVKTIGESAMSNIAVRTVDLSKNTSLTKIETWAFGQSSSLESVKLPASITEMAAAAFANCPSLDTIIFVGTKQPTMNNSIYNIKSTCNVYLPKGDEDDAEAGWDYTKWGVAGADNMIFPDWEYDDSNTDKKLVRGSYELTVTASDKALTITASNSYKGKKLILSNEIKKFGDENGTDVYKVVGIAASVFKDITTLEAVTLPNTLTTLGASAFEGCTALKKATIPATVTTFADKIFYGCTNLLDITYMGKKQPSSFGTDAFTVSNSGTVTDRYVTLPKGKKTDTNWTPASWAITDADHFIFGGWIYDGEANTITIGEDNEQIILGVTLANTKELTITGVKTLPTAELDLTGGIASTDESDETEYTIVGIASNAFQGKTLSKVTLPETLATIGNEAFKDATITELHLSHSDATAITAGADAFALKDKNTCIVRVPDGKLASFHTDKPYSNWQDFTYVLEEKGTFAKISYTDKETEGNTWPYYAGQVAEGSFLAEQAPVGQTFRFFLKHAHADSTFVMTAKLGSTKKEGDNFFYKKDTVTMVTPSTTDAWTLIVTSIGPIVEDSGDKITIKTDEDYKVGDNEKSFNGTIRDTKTEELEIGASDGSGGKTEINIKMEDVTVTTTSPDATAKTTIKSNTEATITLSGKNTLGELDNSGTLILTTTDPDLKLTTTKVTNKGTLVDSTGIITKVEGDASIDLTPLADQKVNTNASVKLTTTATFADGATTTYTWDKYNAEKKEWEQEKTNAPQPMSFKSLRSDADQPNELTVDADDAGQYRCMVTTTKESVSTTLTTFATVTKVTSTPPAPPVYVYYTVTLPEVEGATTTPKAGKYSVEEGDSFNFKLVLDPEYISFTPQAI